ncbi:hypothetical protein [Schaalia sp. lx-260]|uniref:hypothetical protein n=1 Tax=Schaalia sp. lx-260 TaxID=2899082 RepID=UPI001E4E40FA|nr:hypothetical protein [Schaalia sp. lx-260]MCD4549669.1 hypothetical protein [Schaalia sp. lx-260]
MFQGATSGFGVVRLPTAQDSYPSVTLLDANRVQVPAMHLLVDGRYVRVTSTETVRIDSGSSGRKRIDLVCVRYERNASSGVETASLSVLKGSPVSENPLAPRATGGILSGSLIAYYPIAQVTINGITPETPIMLGEQGGFGRSQKVALNFALEASNVRSIEVRSVRRTGDVVTAMLDIDFPYWNARKGEWWVIGTITDKSLWPDTKAPGPLWTTFDPYVYVYPDGKLYLQFGRDVNGFGGKWETTLVWHLKS